MSQKQADTRSKFFGINIFKKSAQILFCIILCVAVAIYITAVCSYDAAVRVSIDGVPVGLVESQEDIAGVKAGFIRSVKEVSEGRYNPEIDVTYDFVLTKDAHYLDADEYADILWARVADDFCDAYMLYMDGRQVAANEDGEALRSLIERIEDQIYASRGSSFESVRISNDLCVEKQVCLKSMLKSVDDIDALINPFYEAEDASAAVMQKFGDDSVLRISAISAASPANADSANLDVDYGLIRGEHTEDFTVDYNFVNTVTVNEIIYFNTLYIDDADNFIGNEKIVCDGQDGEKAVTYEIIYDTEGNIVERKSVAESIITPATDKIVMVGTAEIPDAVPTGTFIWPCEAPKGVSSGYGWRDLYGKPDFHLGIDIPDELGSAIWASDGGTVIWVDTTPSYGKSVKIAHTNGYSTLYAHLNEVLVKVGDPIYKKQTIGTMGKTGIAYGTHLHFEVRINDVTVDPMNYLPE